MNLPNALTLLRMVLIPVFVYSYFRLSPLVALVIYLVASFTDFLDGFLARKWNQVTDFGKLFDPLADKLMTVTMLFCLALTGHVMWWVVIVMLVKELLMMAGSLFMLGNKIVVSSNMYGKVATCAFILALVLVFPWHPFAVMTAVGNVILYIAVALSVLSMAVYAGRAWNQLREPGNVKNSPVD